MATRPENRTTNELTSTIGRLESWKEIAAYLGREVRTVQRWEKEEGLPVHRHAHEKRGSVFAYRSEVDRWREERQRLLEGENGPRRAIWQHPAAYLALATLVVAAGVAAWRWLRQPAQASPPAVITPAAMGRLFASATREGASPRFIPVSRYPTHVALTADSAELWVGATGSVDVIDVATEKPKQQVAISGTVNALALSAGRAYVGTSEGELIVFDIRTKKRLSTVTGLGSVTSLARTPDDRMLYLGGTFRPLKRMDLAKGTVSDVLTASCPMYVAVSPDGRYLFINYQCFGPSGRRGYDSMEVRALPSERVVKTIDGLRNVGERAGFSPSGEQVWAAGGACTAPSSKAECPYERQALIHVFRSSDWALVRTIFVPEGGQHVSFFPDGSRVLASGEVINAATYRVTESVAEQWDTFVVTPDRKRAFSPDYDRDAVAVVDLWPAACVRPTGLTHLWSGDGTANDVAGGEDLELKAQYAPGRVGQAFAFDGHSPAFAATSLPSAASQQREVTYAAWVKPVVTEDNYTVLVVTDAGGVGWRLGTTPDGRLMSCFRPPCLAGAGNALLSATPAVTGKWHHVAQRVQRKPSGQGFEITLFVDGVLQDRLSLEMFAGHNLPPPRDRVRAGDKPFRGLLDEVAVFLRALTDAEIRHLSASPQPLECDPLGAAASAPREP